MHQEIFLIDAPNGKLEVEAIWQTDTVNHDMLAVICHPNPMQGGTMTNKVVSTLFRFCRDCGMNVLRFNFRGVGQSTGITGNGDGEFVDALSVLRFGLSQTQAKKVWLGGFSFGGFIACRVADQLQKSAEFANIELSELALIAPSIIKNDASDLQLPKNSYLIYGKDDELVAPSVLAHFAKQRELPNTVIDTGHFFHAKLVELRNALQQHSRCNL